ncbi:MAG: glycosyltransferase [Alphaproteobacteria bacterium]|nr:glycosyltransferase [Alphaproteobacteria bacterium]
MRRPQPPVRGPAAPAMRPDDTVATIARRLGERDDQHALRLEMFEAIADAVRRGYRPARPPVPVRLGPPPFVSLVICSIDDAKWRAVVAMYGRLLAGRPHEIIGLHDARSLSEAYNRGLARSRGDIVVFSHDDVEFLTDDFADRLAGHLEQFDVIGVAGTTRVAGPSWIQGGWRVMRGQVTTPERQGPRLRVDVYGVDGPVTGDIQAVDGLFVACRREVAETVRFDEATFDGFHLYDTDFGWRAFRAGFRLGVANDLPVLHASRGTLGPAWSGYAQRFLDKYPDQGFQASFGDNPLRAVHLDDRGQVARFCDAILELADRAPPGTLAPAGEPPALLGVMPPGLGRVAHLGLGDGAAGVFYRHRHPDCRYTGWEADPTLAERAGRRLGPLMADPFDLPETVDCLVYEAATLAGLPRPAATIARHLGHLAPNGRVLLVLPNPQHAAAVEGLLRGQPPQAAPFTLEQAVAVLKRAGLDRFEIASCVRPSQNAAGFLDTLAPALAAAGVDRDAFAARAAAHAFVIRAQRHASGAT